MSSKQEIMSRMLEMQRQFIQMEQREGVSMKDYFNPDSGSFLEQYREEYANLSRQLVDIAHAEKGSKR
jgi:hypothetical protein